MAGSGSLEVWRTAWTAHSAAVGAVAVALVGESQAAHLIETTVPSALCNGEVGFDPLDTFVQPMLVRRSRAERRRGAAALIGSGVDEARARSITGAQGLLPSVHASTAQAVTFDRIADLGTDSSVRRVKVRPAARTSTAAERSRPWRPMSRLILAVLLVVGILAGVLIVTATSQSRGVALLAWRGDLAPPWELISASAHEPIAMDRDIPLVERLRIDIDDRQIDLTVGGYGERFADPGLGNTPARTPAMNEYNEYIVERIGRRDVQILTRESTGIRFDATWTETTPDGGVVPVWFTATRFTSRDARLVIAALTAQPDLARNGFTLAGWTPDLTPPRVERYWTPSAELRFSTRAEPRLEVTVTAAPASPASGIPENDGTQGLTVRSRRIRSDLVVTEVSDPFRGHLEWWDRARRMIVVVESRSENGRLLDTTLLADVDRLAASLRFTDADGWRSAVAPLREAMSAQAAVVRSAVGPLDVSYRLFNYPRRAASIICALMVCAPIDYSVPGNPAAELLIAGHWWHVERALLSDPPPQWRTSPASDEPPTFSAAAGDGLRWWAVDLGDRSKVARRNDDRAALARPLA